METLSKSVATMNLTDEVSCLVSVAVKAIHFDALHFSSETELRGAIKKNLVQILLMPLSMNANEVLSLQDQLRSELNPLCVVFIDGRAGIQSIVRAIQLGAITVLPSYCDDENIVNALKSAARIYDERERLIADYRFARDCFKNLSPRQNEILASVISGRTNKASAIALNMSQKTVEKHRHAIHVRTQTASLLELLRLHALGHQTPDVAYCWRSYE